MNRVKITFDSTADLSAQLAERFGVESIPLYVTLGDTTGRDGVDFTQSDVFEYVGRTGQLPKTSAVSTLDYIELFSRLTGGGFDVVHVCISAEFSACFQNAVNAAAEFGGRVQVVDSRNLSTGSGLLVLLGAELAEKGLGCAEIARELALASERAEASFVIETLEYLYKGGRCGALAQFGANLLKLRPCIEVKDGKMSVGRKYRGRLSRCLQEYIDERLDGRSDIDTQRIFITHTVSDPELLGEVTGLVKSKRIFEQVLVTDAGCTISSHCGPGTLGVLFLRKR